MANNESGPQDLIKPGFKELV